MYIKVFFLFKKNWHAHVHEAWQGVAKSRSDKGERDMKRTYLSLLDK